MRKRIRGFATIVEPQVMMSVVILCIYWGERTLSSRYAELLFDVVILR